MKFAGRDRLTMINRFCALVSTIVLALSGLAGCSAKSTSQAASGDIEVTIVGLPDGRGLACAIYAPNSQIGTISCDWAHAFEGLTPDADTPLGARAIESPSGRTVLCVVYAPNSDVGVISCDWIN
jgi:hypothetical protein